MLTAIFDDASGVLFGLTLPVFHINITNREKVDEEVRHKTWKCAAGRNNKRQPLPSVSKLLMIESFIGH